MFAARCTVTPQGLAYACVAELLVPLALRGRPEKAARIDQGSTIEYRVRRSGKYLMCEGETRRCDGFWMAVPDRLAGDG